MSWKLVADEPLPKDRPLLAIFKGWIGILEHLEGEWYFIHNPGSHWYGNAPVDAEFIMKIHYWQDLPKHPDAT